LNKKSWNFANTHNIKYKKKIDKLCDDNELIDPDYEKLICSCNPNRLLHPFCNDGLELIYLSSKYNFEGVGIDFSNVAIRQARKNSKIMNTDCSFYERDINLYEYPEKLCEFDIVFTTLGSFFWINSLNNFFEWVQKVLVRGGSLLIWEFHPNVFQFNPENGKFDNKFVFDVQTIRHESGVDGYIDKTIFLDDSIIISSDFKNIYSVRYNIYSLSKIINSAIESNLIIESFREYPYIYGEKWGDYYEEKSDAMYSIPGQLVPHSFCLKFTK